MNSEIIQRREKARNLMRDRGYEALVLSVAENIQYLTGVTEPSVHACSVLIVTQRSRPVLAVLWLDEEFAQKQTKDADIKTYTAYTQGTIIIKTLKDLGVTKGKIGMDDISLELLRNSLRRSLSNIELINATEEAEGLRSVKTDEEISFIQKACAIADEGMKIAVESLKPGMTELQVASLAEHHMITLGSDRLKHPTILASGPRTKLPHAWATQKQIENGDLVTIDLGAVYNGYCSDIARTAVVGKPTTELRDALNAFRIAQDTVLQQLRPGVTTGEIQIAAEEATKATGYRLLAHVGHNIGLQVEEHPFLESSTAVGSDSKIERNMIVAFFQGSIQANQNLGIRLENTALITESGAKMLTTYPRNLFFQ